MAKTVKYKKGSVVFLEGETPKYIYILREGGIEISRVKPETEKTVYKTVQSGYFFGVKNMLLNMTYMSTAIATEDSTIILLSVDEFEEFIFKDSKVNIEMIKNLTYQLKQIHEKLYEKFDSPREKENERGMLHVAKSFFDMKEYQICKDICDKFLAIYPKTKYQTQIDDILEKIEKKTKNLKQEDEHPTFSDTNNPEIILPDSFKRYEKTIPARKVVFSEFEKGDSFFMVISGIVRSTKHINNTNVNISLAKPGEFFGLNAFVGMEARDVTCITTDTVKVLEFAHKDFEAIILSNPQIAFMFLKLLAKRIYLDRKILKNSYIADLQIRLKDMIAVLDDIGLCERIGIGSRKVNLTATNMAAWTNISADAIQKQLDVMETQGIIKQTEDGYFIVKDIEKMHRISERVQR